MVAGFASVLGKQARGTVLLEAPQQTKYLTPLEADQHTGVSNTQTTRLNPQQHLKTAELLLAHRQHRHHGAPPGTPEPAGVSPLSCRGVSSLYCAYRKGPWAYDSCKSCLFLHKRCKKFWPMHYQLAINLLVRCATYSMPDAR